MSDERAIMIASTNMIAQHLTDEELASAYRAATSGWAISPDLICYEKIKPLLTQENGTKMHPATIEALGHIVERRFGEVAG